MALDQVNGNVVPVTRARVLRIEQRLADIASASEQRDAVLRDAIADFVAAELAERDDEIQKLKEYITQLEAQLQQKTTVDELVNEAVTRLDAKQLARDESKRGPKGHQGERGARGEKGPAGPRGPAGRPAVAIHSWLVDREKFRVTPYLDDGTALPNLELRPLFESYHTQANREAPS